MTMTPDIAIRVLIVEDHPLMRLGVASIIGAQENMTVVAEEIRKILADGQSSAQVAIR